MVRLKNGLKVITNIDKAVVAGNVGENMEDLLKAQGIDAKRLQAVFKNPQELIDAINNNGAQIAISRTGWRYNKEVLQKTPELALIHGACKGPKVDIPVARELGIDVLNADTNATAVVGLIISYLFDYLNPIREANTELKEGRWDKKKRGLERRSIHNRTFAIYGFGNIGQTLAKTLKALSDAQGWNLNIIAYNHKYEINRPYDTNIESRAEELGVKLVSRDEIFHKGDFVSVHIGDNDSAGNENTDDITTEDLSKMKGRDELGRERSGVFMNAARFIVASKPEDLNKLLKDGTLSRAYIDVFDPNEEQVGGNFLPKNAHPNLIPTDHIGGSQEGLAERTAIDLDRRLSPWVKNGGIRTSLLWRRHTLSPPSRFLDDGTLAVRITRSTHRNASGESVDAFYGHGLEKLGESQLDDRIDGFRTSDPNGRWKQVPHFINMNSLKKGAYAETIRSTALALDALNEKHPGTVGSVRFFPTNDKQREAMRNMNWRGIPMHQ